MRKIRPARSDDRVAITTVLKAAFPSETEARLVERLLVDGAIRVALVVEDEGEVAGYVALSEMSVKSGGRPIDALGLAPVAVIPEKQGQGMGAELIKAAIGEARKIGAELIVLLGDPGYYGQFGFDAKTAEPFRSPYAGPYLQALRLVGDGPYPPGSAEYARAFSAMDVE